MYCGVQKKSEGSETEKRKKNWKHNPAVVRAERLEGDKMFLRKNKFQEFTE